MPTRRRPCPVCGTSWRSIAASRWSPTAFGPPRKAARPCRSSGTKGRSPDSIAGSSASSMRNSGQTARGRGQKRRRRGRQPWAALPRNSKRCMSCPTSPTRTMEPLNCVADVRPDRCEVWTGHAVPNRRSHGRGTNRRTQTRTGQRSTPRCWAVASAGAPSSTATSCVRRCRFPKPSRRRSK